MAQRVFRPFGDYTETDSVVRELNRAVHSRQTTDAGRGAGSSRRRRMDDDLLEALCMDYLRRRGRMEHDLEHTGESRPGDGLEHTDGGRHRPGDEHMHGQSHTTEYAYVEGGHEHTLRGEYSTGHIYDFEGYIYDFRGYTYDY